MRIGIRSAISALVLTSIVVSAVGVHLLWWRTAQAGQPDPGRHHQRADRLRGRRRTAVGHHRGARSSMIAVRTLLTEKVLDTRDAKARSSCSCRNCSRSRPFPGWRSDGRTARSLPGTSSAIPASRCLRSRPDRKLRDRPLRICRRRYQAQGAAASKTPSIPSPIRNGFARHQTDDEHWSTLTAHPRGERLAAAFAGADRRSTASRPACSPSSSN